MEAGLRPAVDPWIEAAIHEVALAKELGVPADRLRALRDERPDLIEGTLVLLEARAINADIAAKNATPTRGR